jgi:hypothetical protein
MLATVDQADPALSLRDRPLLFADAYQEGRAS